LVLTARRAGRRPFDVQLAVPKGVARLHVSRARRDLEVSIADFPFRRTAVGSLPLGKVRATEQHHRVRRRPPGPVLRARFARRDDRRLRTAPVVDLPLLLGSRGSARTCARSQDGQHDRGGGHSAHAGQDGFVHWYVSSLNLWTAPRELEPAAFTLYPLPLLA